MSGDRPYSAIPQRAASNRDDGRRSAAALFAAWRIRADYGSVASRNRLTCASANPRSESAVARCVINPTTSAPGFGSSESPQRPIPVSSFRCTRRPSGISSPRCASSSSPSRASAIARLVAVGPITRIRARENCSRSSSPSATVATHSAPAPSSTATPATSTAPCPYAFAFTTAQSWAPSSARSKARALRRTAPRSTVTSLRCIFPPALHVVEPELEQGVDEDDAPVLLLELPLPKQRAHALVSARLLEIDRAERPCAVGRVREERNGPQRPLLVRLEPASERVELGRDLVSGSRERVLPVVLVGGLARSDLVPEPVRQQHRPLRMPVRGGQQRVQDAIRAALRPGEALRGVGGNFRSERPRPRAGARAASPAEDARARWPAARPGRDPRCASSGRSAPRCRWQPHRPAAARAAAARPGRRAAAL